MLRTTSSIIGPASAQDTPLADSSDVLSKCRPPQSRDLPLRLHEPPRPTGFRFRRTLLDQPHMQLRSASVTTNTINMSFTDKVAVAVCASVVGTGIVVMAIYIMMHRRRRKILDAQDTLPRPFEVIVPAATSSNTSMITHHLTSPPTLSIPRRIYSRNGGRCRYEPRRKEFSARIKPSGADSAPIPIETAPSQSQPITRMQSNASLLSNHAGPSSYRIPLRSSTRPHTLTPPDPQPQSGSRVQPGQSSFPTGAQTQPRSGVSASRSASVQERRSDKNALWLSRSASELYSTTSSPRHRVPGYGPHAPSGRHAYRHGGSEPHVNTFPHPTNHLRQWHSALPVMDVQHVCSDSEEDLGVAIIFQHQDAGVMQELPPPYHKLVRSGVDV
ncbi:hypothetical protein J3R82DRAFT_7695 [Butyriboletus roseoflavus]|nr:hypothetical protein J3R82DRAFT_7695 [Butyriboletus roseoflavus]